MPSARQSTGRTMTTEEYLQHAEECERLAGLANLQANRHALLASAEMWRKLAADAKGDGAGPSPSVGHRPKSQETRET
jgi:hypothetical protein